MLKHSSFVALACILLLAPDAFASMTTSGLPTDTGFQTLYNFITGEYAYIATIVGVVGACVAYYFGQDATGFLKGLLNLICVMCFVLGAASFVSLITGKGALIA